MTQEQQKAKELVSKFGKQNAHEVANLIIEEHQEFRLLS